MSTSSSSCYGLVDPSFSSASPVRPHLSGIKKLQYSQPEDEEIDMKCNQILMPLGEEEEAEGLKSSSGLFFNHLTSLFMKSLPFLILSSVVHMDVPNLKRVSVYRWCHRTKRDDWGWVKRWRIILLAFICIKRQVPTLCNKVRHWEAQKWVTEWVTVGGVSCSATIPAQNCTHNFSSPSPTSPHSLHLISDDGKLLLWPPKMGIKF